MRSILLITSFALAAAPAWAGDVLVSLRDAAGAPVRDAVVMLLPDSGRPPGPIHFPWPLVVAQQDIQFDPFVLIVPVGAEVAFPNRDKVRHHVYSFSPGNRFELKLYGRQEDRTVVFRAAGAAAIGCNIHDRMVGFIRVVDTPFAVKTDASGQALIRGAPDGAATLTVWHPYLRAPKGETSSRLVVPPKGAVREAFQIALRTPAGQP